MRVVIAPDAFKGSATAAEVARHLADGVLAAAPDAQVTLLPMADGGEGTLDALLSVWGVEARELTTVDAIGRPHRARYGVSADGRIGVVELAAASGLPGVSDVGLQPLHAHTRGTGALAAAVLDAGVEEVVVCLGGSASTDGEQASSQGSAPGCSRTPRPPSRPRRTTSSRAGSCPTAARGSRAWSVSTSTRCTHGRGRCGGGWRST